MSEVTELNQLLRQVLRKTVHEKGNERAPTIIQIAMSADEAPHWWTERRDKYLRKFFPTEPYLAGALYSVCSRNAAYRVEFNGPDEGVAAAKRLFSTANMFKGFQNFNMKLSLSLYTQDNGAMFEVIRPARVRTKGFETKAVKNSSGEWAAVGRGGKLLPLTGTEYKLIDRPNDLPIGIATLDPARCSRTGDPEWPIVYTDLKRVPHKLRWWQVVMLNDMPSDDETMRGVGFCAVSRALRLSQTLRDMQVYKQEKVRGRFAGAIFITNAGAGVIQDAIAEAQEQADNRALSRYAPPIIADTMEPNQSVSVAEIKLASLPDNYDEETYLRWYIAGLALDFGVDYGFLAPLPGNKLGTSEQAEVAERQSRGKASRLFMATMEEKFNYGGLLPRGVWMEYKEVDIQEELERDMARMRRAQTRMTMIQSGEITPEMARQLAIDAGDYEEELLDLIGEEDVVESEGEEAAEEKPKRFWNFGRLTEKLAREPAEKSQKAHRPFLYTEFLKQHKGYESQLLETFDAWLKRWAGKLAKRSKSRRSIRRATSDLVRQLQQVADDGLEDAYLFGYYTGDSITRQGRQTVKEWSDRNRRYLETSLALAIEQDLDDLDDWIEDAIIIALSVFAGRIALYSQPHWVLGWLGMGEAVQEEDEEAEIPTPITRYLDPTVINHCATCPPKARTYPSWQAMLEQCGGVPGDGSDACGPACRCGLRIG